MTWTTVRSNQSRSRLPFCLSSSIPSVSSSFLPVDSLPSFFLCFRLPGLRDQERAFPTTNPMISRPTGSGVLLTRPHSIYGASTSETPKLRPVLQQGKPASNDTEKCGQAACSPSSTEQNPAGATQQQCWAGRPVVDYGRAMNALCFSPNSSRAAECKSSA